MTLEHLLELDAGRQSTNNTGIFHIVFVLSENIPRACDEDALLRVPLRAIPPASDDVWQKHTKQGTIDKQNVLPISFRDDELREGDADTEALFAVGMTVLNVVVTDLFISQRLIRLGDLDKALVEGLDSLVLRRVRLNLVRVEDKGETLVVPRNRFLIGTLEFHRISKFPCFT